ncbi:MULTISPECIES: LysR family transcriptional regulator [Stenotrophomonas]|jgi:DNA-binding transcriptional LysR family regulator|uniref:LysR family transcriptional regulator n=1 Tax=Stenotrophomonas maltophilia TaxID=40324 RepID=A0A4S2D464_STEMA|nr:MULTISPECIES: LysR family transcriptional regulator [Stenotrophomonas]TGY35782.1 LysR family transcriptional regulator [Stenotrophomonas maltophilia]
MSALDNLGNLQTFVQVADTRSFVETGRLQGITASAAGKSVTRLEQALGVRLFHRSTRSITLTAEGERFLVRCRRILDERDAARTELADQTAAPVGVLRLGLPLVGDLSLPILTEFMAAYPGIRLELDFDDRLVDVVEEGFDAVLRVGDPGDSRLSARRLGVFPRYLVAAPEYLACRGTPRTAADLRQHDCLHYRFPSTGKLEPWPVPAAPGQPPLDLPVSMVSNTIEARLAFALAGRGIAYLPEHSARDALADGRLQRVLADQIHACGTFYLLWPSGRHVLPKLRVFIDFVSARLTGVDC